jgi:uncharacterized membrane protein YjgN (DUF898 family)
MESAFRARGLETRPEIDARGHELFGIFIRNVLLSVLSLGIYRFWGRTRLRRYLWSHVSFLGDRFEYTGTGRELFRGFMRAAVVLAVLFALHFTASMALRAMVPPLALSLDAIWGVGLLYLALVGAFGARRYRLSRTLWRGIRGAQGGSSWAYAARGLFYWLLTAVTLGFYAPFRSINLTRYETETMSFGNRVFAFDGRGADLLPRYALAWFLTLPTLGIAWFWYQAHYFRYIAEHTRWGHLRFRAEVTGGALLVLTLSNLVLVVLTLGLAYPWAVLRRLRFLANTLVMVGEVEAYTVTQSTAEVPATGEGLFDLLDTGWV